MIRVYCDGSWGPSSMSGVYESASAGSNVGRTVVVVPALDFAVLERVPATQRGADSNAMERAAIERALALVAERAVTGAVVYTDSLGSVRSFAPARVEWLSRDDNYAGKFFHLMLGRASYLRASMGAKRRPPTPTRREVLELFQCQRREILLSGSGLWKRIVTLYGAPPEG